MDTSETSETSDSASAGAELTPETTATSADAIEAAPVVIDWNGELESLQGAEWLATLDEPTRAAIIEGIEAKYRNYNKGYQRKYGELAQQRRAYDAEIQQVRDESAAAMQAAQELRDEATRLWYEGGEGADPAQLQALQQRISELEAAAVERQSQLDRYEQADVDQLVERMQKELPDIYENDDALEMYVRLLESEIPDAQAITMTRAIYQPNTPPTRPSIPASVEAAGRGDAGAGVTPKRALTFDEVMSYHLKNT
jgi:uncharacterized protein YlxW (UPF0749 family)